MNPSPVIYALVYVLVVAAIVLVANWFGMRLSSVEELMVMFTWGIICLCNAIEYHARKREKR